jgi:PIN domain nuclease of toxin-antitoxin system
MSQLLDSHTFIWFLEGDAQLSVTARKAIEKENVSNFISIASLWEISIKISLGKLELKSSFDKLAQLIAENGFIILPITFEDTVRLSNLPFHHKDPFDRIIISQAINNTFSIISKDRFFDDYDVSIIW